MATAKRVLVPLAEGFEEIEAITIIDTLRRADVEVVSAGLKGKQVVGAHGIAIAADREFDGVDIQSFDMIVLPGGMPGTTNLADDSRVLDASKTLHASGKHVTAICAAPTVLAKAGVISKTAVTCYPGFEARLGDACFVEGERVVRAGKIVTSRGPGTALEFSLALVTELCGAERARSLGEAMVARA